MNVNNGIPKNLHGIGVSTLSIKNKAHSEPEELIGDKDVGLVGYVNSEKVVSSAFYTSRIKSHLSKFIDNCIRDNVVGKIYRISLNDELVRTVPNTMNVFDNILEYKFGNTAPTAFRFDIDADYYDRKSNNFKDGDDVIIKIEFSLIKNNETKNFFIEEKFSQINDKAYKFDFSSFSNDFNRDANGEPIPDDYNMIINSLNITMPNGFDITKTIFVIYDILLAIV